MKKIFRFLLIGTLSIIPFAVVIQVLLWVHGFFLGFFDKLSSVTNSTLYTTAIIIGTLSIITFLGYSLEKFGKSFIISFFENILNRIPAINTIYSISKKIVSLFISKDKENKKEVVLIQYPKKDMWVMAYVVSRHKEVYSLFVPTSPNPTSGYTIMVHKSQVHKTTLSIEEASTFIVSMGADFVKKEELFDIITADLNK